MSAAHPALLALILVMTGLTSPPHAQVLVVGPDSAPEISHGFPPVSLWRTSAVCVCCVKEFGCRSCTHHPHPVIVFVGGWVAEAGGGRP